MWRRGGAAVAARSLLPRLLTSPQSVPGQFLLPPPAPAKTLAGPLCSRLLANPHHHIPIGGPTTSPAASCPEEAVSARPLCSRILATSPHHPTIGGSTSNAASSAPLAEAAGAPATSSSEYRVRSESLQLCGLRFCQGQRRYSSESSRHLDNDVPPDLMSAPILPTSSSTGSFDVYVGNNIEFLEEYTCDVDECMNVLSVDYLKNIFEKEVEPACHLRCLISPFGLEGLDAAMLHNSYNDRIGYFPKYMTSLDLMTTLVTTKKCNWASYLNYLSQERFLIVIDWTTRLNTDAAATLYDHGLQLASQEGDDRLHFKGECDASVKKNLAKISFLVWSGTQIHSSQVYYNIPCEEGDNNQAEAFAMYLMLKRGIEEGLHLHKMEVRTDSMLVYEILTGGQEVHEQLKHYKLYMLLRYMRSFYGDLICLWQPREKLMFADGLIRGPVLPENTEQRAAGIRKMQRAWAPYLQGCPIFICKSYPKKLDDLNKMAKRKVVITDTHRSCYLEVADKDKVSAIWHIGVALRPASRVYVALKKNNCRPNIVNEMNSLLLNGVSDCSTREDYTLLSFDDSRLSRDEATGIDLDLLIVFDASISETPVISNNTFVVYLCTPEEKCIMVEQMIPKYGPLSFVSFCPTRKARHGEKALVKQRLEAEEALDALLGDVSRALTMLASETYVSKERQETMSLVNSKIDTWMLAAQGPQDKESPETGPDKNVSPVLLAQVNIMLQELEKEAHDIDTQIMSLSGLLDRGNHGRWTEQDVRTASSDLKESRVKGHIQRLIFKLRKEARHQESVAAAGS